MSSSIAGNFSLLKLLFRSAMKRSIVPLFHSLGIYPDCDCAILFLSKNLGKIIFLKTFKIVKHSNAEMHRFGALNKQ